MDRATRTAWRLALVGVVLLMLAAGFIGTSCPPPPAPVTADSLAAARAGFAADTARAWGAARRAQAVADSALRDSRTAKAEAARLRTRRVSQPVRVAYTSDSTPMVPKADFDSLAAEADSLWSVVVSDSVAIKAQNDRIRADSLAYDALASLRADENRIHTSEITTLRTALTRAQRGPRLLGLLPMPQLTCGYGATLTGGAIRTGPQCGLSIPVRL